MNSQFTLQIHIKINAKGNGKCERQRKKDEQLGKKDTPTKEPKTHSLHQHKTPSTQKQRLFGL
jgi:hypothetical protein